MKRISILTLLVFASFAALAQDDAHPHHQRSPWAHFSQMDTDGDGRISAEEFSTGNAERFTQLDSDGDGYITEADMPTPPPHPRMPGHLIVVADADKSGDITAEEWASFLAAIGQEGSSEINFDALHALLTDRMGGFHRPPHPPEGAPLPGDVNEDGNFDTNDLTQIFNEMDANDDGVLSGDELPHMRHHEAGEPGQPRQRRSDARKRVH